MSSFRPLLERAGEILWYLREGVETQYLPAGLRVSRFTDGDLGDEKRGPASS